MRKMKDSGIEWIGQIPEDWEMKRIGSLYSERRFKVSDSDYAPLSVTKKGILPQLDTVAKTDAHDDRKLVLNGDFVINSRSDRRGSCGISDLNGSVSLINTVLTPKSKLEKGYYRWLFSSVLFADEFYKWGHGIVDDLWTTNWNDMKSIMIPYPSITAQQSIATYLDHKCSEIDNIVRETEQTIEEYKKLKQSLITEVVTGKKHVAADGLSLSNEPRKMKDSGVEWIGEVPEEWEIMRLKGLGSCQNGISKNAEYFGEDFEYPFVNYTDAYNNFVVPQPKGRANSSKEDRTRYSLKEGDVLFTRTSETIEEIGYASTCMDTIENAVFSGFLIRFRPTSTVLFKGYSKYYFRSSHLRRYFVKEMNLVTRASLSQQLLKGMSVLLPSLEEQHLIATYLDAKCVATDKLIADKQTLLLELDTYKKSLIYECVTGKKEIN